MIPARSLPLFVLCVLLLLPALGAAREMNAEESEAAVWQLEEAYWRYVKANDLEGYRTLWDERFVGWPGFAEHPVGKANITDWIPPLHADPDRLYDYRVQKEAVRAFGDSVVVHYFYWESRRDAKTGAVVQENEPRRITHTWQRRGDSWQIITGMSATYEH
ncbi:MAG: nuclear transport factor 2 family protein [Lysobacterales bacterium]|nr:MAG: nuclear transport factor 2 family protein [Xanthomonadales bacterium]